MRTCDEVTLIDWAARAERDRRDLRLFQGMRAGWHDAFGHLYRSYHGALRRLALGYTHDERDAEDVVQEVFADLWRIRDQVDLRTTVASYLCGAVRNRSIDVLRRRAVERRWGTRHSDAGRSGQMSWLSQGAASGVPSLVAAVGFNGGETRLLARDLKTAINEAVGAMPPRCRAVFLLSRGASGDVVLSYAEIGQALGIARATVRVQLVKALSILEARLATAGWSNVLRREKGRRDAHARVGMTTKRGSH
jgi:RNA polymerase sigma-70 factor (ECF subfamily)